jgi:leucyl-tRNA synthetase
MLDALSGHAQSPDPAVVRKLHQTIRKVGDDLPRLAYNTAIAAMMEYLNVVRRAERHVHISEIQPLVQLLSPFAPHAAEEMWERLGNRGSIFDAGWPAFDADLAAEELITMAVQVNGKTRGTIAVSPDIAQDGALSAALADPAIARFVTGQPAKVIFVRGRLLNLVL